MSEFQAFLNAGRISTCHLNAAPNGRFYFVGRVPVALSYVRIDGAEMTDKDAENCASFGPRVSGCKSLSFATREDALAAAAACDAEIVNEGA